MSDQAVPIDTVPPIFSVLEGDQEDRDRYWAVFKADTPKRTAKKLALQRAREAGGKEPGEVRVLEHVISYYEDSPWKVLIATVDLAPK